MSRARIQGARSRVASRTIGGILVAGLMGLTPTTGWLGGSAAAAESGAPSPDASLVPDRVGLATPEDAIRAYLAGVAAADVTRVLDASAVDQMSSGFQFDLQVDRLQAMQLTQSLAPATDPFYVGVNQAVQRSWLLGQVRNLAYSLLSTEAIDGNIIVPADTARAEAFAASVDPSRLSGLTVQDIRFPNAALEHDARYLANAATLAGIYGADEMTERLALVSLDGTSYTIGFTLLHYGDDWRVSSQSSALAGTSALGTAQPTTAQEYDRLTSGE
jgi:hypothetical protein